MNYSIALPGRSEVGRVLRRFSAISPNDGLRRHNDYFPACLPSHVSADEIRISICPSDGYDGLSAPVTCSCSDGIIRLRVLFGGGATADAAVAALKFESIEMICRCFDGLRRRTESECEALCRAVSPAAAVVIDHRDATPMQCVVRTSVSMRGARWLATRYGGECYGAIAAASFLRDRLKSIIEMLDRAKSAVRGLESAP
jgi:hypothetical protein